MTPEIKDEWVARLSSAQLQPLYQARQARRMVEDEVHRARVAVTDAENEVSSKNSLREAADKRVEAARQVQEAARQTGDPNQTFFALTQVRVVLIGLPELEDRLMNWF